MEIDEKMDKSKKKVLIVEDSALMRRMICDIIATDERFQVADKAINGLEALELLQKNKYDIMILDVNMPKMNGIELLKELQQKRIPIKVMMSSTDTREGAKVTMDALELGALDFIQKPDNFMEIKTDIFRKQFLDMMNAIALSRQNNLGRERLADTARTTSRPEPATTSSAKPAVGTGMPRASEKRSSTGGNKIVAIACSTGGPKALQSVVPLLPKDLAAPVLIVQHMPAGFTKTLSERLDLLSEISVKEAEEGETVKNGCVYIAKGGVHMNAVTEGNRCVIHYSNQPNREGVKPCANYMYESLMNSSYSEIVCVVLTGMGADGTQGIANLDTKKKIHVIAQDENTSTVYGMPKAVHKAGLTDQIVPLDEVAKEIVMNVGVK